MPAYKYVGCYERSYGGRRVLPGDVVELDSVPASYEFILAEAAPETPVEPASAPLAADEPLAPEPPPAPAVIPAAANPYTQPPQYVH